MRNASEDLVCGLLVCAMATSAACSALPAFLPFASLLSVLASRLFRGRLKLSSRSELLLWAPGIAVMLVSVFNPFAEPAGAQTASGNSLSSAAEMIVAYGLLLGSVLPWTSVPGGNEKMASVSLGLMVVLGRKPFSTVYAACVAVYGILLLFLLAFHRRDVSSSARSRIGGVGNPGTTVTVRPLLVAGHCVLAVVAAWSMAVFLPPMERYTVEKMMYGASSRGCSAFSAVTDLNRIGSIARSRTIVLRVRSVEAPGHLRGLVYDHYRMGRWRSTKTRPVRRGPSAPASLPGAKLERPGGGRTRGPAVREARVYCEAPATGVVFAPLGTVSVDCNDPGAVRWDGHLAIRLPGASAWSYRTGDSRPVAPGAYWPEDLELPPGLDARIRRLAERIAGNAEGPAATASAIERWLQGHCRYSLAGTMDVPAGSDPAEYFLLVSRKGHCELFATAMVLMARSLGLRSRYVTGFVTHERNPLTGLWLARELHAHAWCEVLIPGAGWTTYDPTASGQGVAEGGTSLLDWIDYIAGWCGDIVRRASAWWSRSGMAGRLRSVLWLVFAVVTAILLAGPMKALLKVLAAWLALLAGRARRNSPGVDAAARLLSMLEAAALQKGFSRRDGETVREFARRLAEVDGRLERIALEIAELFGACRYGGRDIDDESMAGIVERFEQDLDGGAAGRPGGSPRR